MQYTYELKFKCLLFHVYVAGKPSTLYEVFIEIPSNLEARSLTWSTYKHHNTIKFLIGITPCKRDYFILVESLGRVPVANWTLATRALESGLRPHDDRPLTGREPFAPS